MSSYKTGARGLTRKGPSNCPCPQAASPGQCKPLRLGVLESVVQVATDAKCLCTILTRGARGCQISVVGNAQASAGHGPQLPAVKQALLAVRNSTRGLQGSSCLNYADSNAAVSLSYLCITTARKALKLPWQSKAGSPWEITVERSFQNPLPKVNKYNRKITWLR